MIHTLAQITLEEFLNLPETEPASEYVNGRMIHKANASRRTQRYSNRVSHCY